MLSELLCCILHQSCVERTRYSQGLHGTQGELFLAIFKKEAQALLVSSDDLELCSQRLVSEKLAAVAASLLDNSFSTDPLDGDLKLLLFNFWSSF